MWINLISAKIFSFNNEKNIGNIHLGQQTMAKL